MEILIAFDATEPPAGRVRVPGRDEHEDIRFTGWLGLLRVLSELIGSPAPEGKEP
ncbi:MAG TPA: hypothetical protein VFX25_09650 [Streptosporangiaceae bacterium]|nr:hypothetical protein [Streptosporangiaceae bacterium]HEX5289122.1 hypothetical protein [Streptosporangiaceae bacterium]